MSQSLPFVTNQADMLRDGVREALSSEEFWPVPVLMDAPEMVSPVGHILPESIDFPAQSSSKKFNPRPDLDPRQPIDKNRAVAPKKGDVMSTRNLVAPAQNRLTPWLMALACLTAFGISQAMAQPALPAATCQSACAQKAQAHNNTCREDGCQVHPRQVIRVCEEVCRPQPAPTDGELETMASMKAAELAGMPVDLYETTEYLQPNGETRTRLFVFTTDRLPPRGVLRTIMLNSRASALINQRMFSVEVGVAEGLPPIVGYWQGLPIEHRVETQARERIAEVENSNNPRLLRRYGSAITPVLEFEDDRGRIAVDGRTLTVVRNPEFRAPRSLERSGAQQLSVRQAWRNRLNALR